MTGEAVKTRVERGRSIEKTFECVYQAEVAATVTRVSSILRLVDCDRFNPLTPLKGTS